MPSILLDTNLLLRSAQPSHTAHTVAVEAIDVLRQIGNQLCLVPQNIFEFWVVATRPIEQNGLGKNIEEAQAEIFKLKTLFPLLPDGHTIYPEWERLVTENRV